MDLLASVAFRTEDEKEAAASIDLQDSESTMNVLFEERTAPVEKSRKGQS